MKLFIYIFFLLFSVNSFGQLLDGNVLSVIAYWQEGETLVYEKTKYRSEKKEVGLPKEIESKSLVRFDILSESDTNYVIEYRIDSLLTLQSIQQSALVNSVVGELTKSLVYKIETTENGEFKQIINWEELRDHMNNLIDQYFEHMLKSKKEQADIRKFMTAFTGSKEIVETTLKKDIGFLFSMYGYQYNTTEVHVYDQVIQNPFGETPFPSEGTIRFKAHDNEEVIRMIDESSIDEEEGKKAIVEVLTMMAPDDTDLIEFKKTLSEAEFKISDRIEMDINTNNGIIEYGLQQRTMRYADNIERGERVNRIEFRLIH